MKFSVIDRTKSNWPEHNAALWYEWDMDGTNIEWRECVNEVVRSLRKKFDLVLIEEPEFQGHQSSAFEDFLEIKYRIDEDSELIFSNDALLSTIWLVSENTTLLREIESNLGQEYGWYR